MQKKKNSRDYAVAVITLPVVLWFSVFQVVSRRMRIGIESDLQIVFDTVTVGGPALTILGLLMWKRHTIDVLTIVTVPITFWFAVAQVAAGWMDIGLDGQLQSMFDVVNIGGPALGIMALLAGSIFAVRRQSPPDCENRGCGHRTG